MLNMIMIIEQDTDGEKKYASVRLSTESTVKIGQVLKEIGGNFVDGKVTFEAPQGVYDELARRMVEKFTDVSQSHLHHPKLSMENFYKTLGLTILEEVVKQPETK